MNRHNANHKAANDFATKPLFKVFMEEGYAMAVSVNNLGVNTNLKIGQVSKRQYLQKT